MRHSATLPRRILIPLALSAIAMFLALGVLLATQKRATAAAPDYRVARLGGLEYEAMQGRPLDPADPVDGRIVAGLSAADRRTPRGAILFGAFVSVTNAGSRAVPTADRIALRDERGRVYHPLPLPAADAYAYAPRVIHPRTRIPGHGTPAADNLAATGLLLPFRIPAAAYEDGVLELVIHDPSHPRRTASLIV